MSWCSGSRLHAEGAGSAQHAVLTAVSLSRPAAFCKSLRRVPACRRYTWSIINTTLSIFVAVMTFQGFDAAWPTL